MCVTHSTMCLLSDLLVWVCLYFYALTLCKCHLCLCPASLSTTAGLFRSLSETPRISRASKEGLGLRDVDVMILHFWSHVLFDRSVCQKLRPVTQRFLVLLSNILREQKNPNQSVLRNVPFFLITNVFFPHAYILIY